VVAQNVTFWILAVAMVLAALGVVRSKNVVHAALYLVVVLAGAAAQYILLAAEFVAWVQVIIYIGAVIILFLFGIMLTRAPMQSEESLDNDQRWPAAVVATFLVGVLATFLIQAFEDKEIVIGGKEGAKLLATGRASTVADTIFHFYVVPFELVSILLLAALVGAVVIARRD
jgi:NADH-quinone oxidoreductase subunit J